MAYNTRLKSLIKNLWATPYLMSSKKYMQTLEHKINNFIKNKDIKNV